MHGSQLTTVSALPRTWVGTGHLLSMHVMPPGITTHDSLCSPPCLGRHWKCILYTRYKTRDYNSRQSLLFPVPGLCSSPCLGRHWTFTLYARYATRDHNSRQSLLFPVPGYALEIYSLCTLCHQGLQLTTVSALSRAWVGTEFTYARYATRDYNSRQSLLSFALGRHWTFTLYARYATRDYNSRQSLLPCLGGRTFILLCTLYNQGLQLTTVSALRTWVGTGHLLSMHVMPPGITTHDSLCSPPPVWAGTGHLFSMHVIQPGITTHDSLCSPPYLGRHWTFTFYARYATMDHNSRQSLLPPPVSAGTGHLFSMHGLQLTTVSALPRAWVGTGNLLSMHVIKPGITTHYSLCSPPGLGRHWNFTLYARYTTSGRNSRQCLPSNLSGIEQDDYSVTIRLHSSANHLRHVRKNPVSLTLYGRQSSMDHWSRYSLPFTPRARKGYLLCMVVTAARITAHDILCPPIS
ncbi:hypothetical protein J6590_074391 [Homalodisca vitripennis]|nr:hypothetical protein J6590_074391 [Homalodisca vitripennis]